MSKLSKLLKNPKNFFIDAYKNKISNINLDFSFIKRLFSLNQYSYLEKLFIYLFVVLTSFSFTYYYIVGRDKYIVKSSVLVRKSGKSNAFSGNIAALLGGFGNQSSLEDSRVLEVYLKSPTILYELEKFFDFNNAYRKKGLDIFSGIKLNANRDEKFNYLMKQIKVFTNQRSGILDITVKGFKPEDAYIINNFLIKKAEEFVNNLNYEIYKKQLEFSKGEVNLAKEKLDLEMDKLKQFQADFKLINIKYEAEAVSKIIAALEEQLIKLKIKLSDTKRAFVREDIPEIEFLQDQIVNLTKQIELERVKLVSEDGRALNERAAELNEINSNIGFLKELYKTTLATSESNRINSIQQQRFLALLLEPVEPIDAWHYWRHKSFLTYLIIVLIAISLSKFILGISESHKK